MKLYCDLTVLQKEKAITYFLHKVANSVATCAITFNDKANGNNLQAQIDKIRVEAERLHTPWFIVDMLLKDEYIAGELKIVAECQAKEVFFLEDDEEAIQLRDLK